MRYFRLQNLALALSMLALVGFVENLESPAAYAQTAVTGALSGVVADSTGAVVPGATVVVIDLATNATQKVVTNSIGRYTVGLLRPGHYKVSASAPGLQSETFEVTAILGTTETADIKVTPKGDKTIIEVNESALPLVDTQNVALATTFSEEQIQQLPTPGGDVTTVAFTAAGVVVNAGGSYGNFSSDGLPGISNLFVMNGFDNQDPFLNLNNSGSSNLTLGQGELADATVIQNAYNSQYGRAAGAILDYTTKSGGNKFHGEAVYDYNGTILNANGWFANQSKTARPHAVSNEWALNGGGPIIKDKLFFFTDYEGLHYVLPNSSWLSLPSSEYQAYALAKAPAASQSTYAKMFNLYKAAPSYSGATATATVASGTAGQNLTSNGGGCGAQYAAPKTGTASPTNLGAALGGLSGVKDTVTGGTFGITEACTLSAYAQANNINIEWLFTQRVDWNLSDKHKIYGRYKMDHGSQPTATSFINPTFNIISTQPEYEGQFNDSYTVTPNLVNSAVVAANWYTAYFGPSDISAAQDVLPFYANFGIGADGSGTSQQAGLSNIGAPYYFPEGRNVTQYQIEDDLSWTRGKNSFKFGANFRRDDIEDYDAGGLTKFPLLSVESLGDIAQGSIGSNSTYYTGDSFEQAFTSAATAHLALYNLGVYAQDDLQVTPRLKLTLGIRADRTGDPLCHGNCFALMTGASDSLSTGYKSLVNKANAHPFSVDAINIQPRFGFNFQLDEKTSVRGGAGLFADLYPAGFLDGPIQNFPNYNAVTVYNGNVADSGTGSLPAFASSVNSAILNGFATGSVTSINSALTLQGVPFAPPSINAAFSGTFHEPQYIEFSLQLQRQLSKTDGISVTYAGNYGYNEIIQNPYANASSGAFDNTTGAWASAGTFAGLSATPANPSFSAINSYTNNAHSNYSGLSVSYTHQGNGLTAHLSYTYSHALDEISNGGVGEDYTSTSILKQLTPALGPGNLNYSNADYDIRNDLVGDFVYEEPFKVHNKIANNLVSGWLVSGKTYYRSGTPFSITSTSDSTFPTLASSLANYSNSLMPEVSTYKLANTSASNPHYAAISGNSSLDSTQYVAPSSQTTFGNLRRNALYGPHYADTDLTLTKRVVKTEGIAFTLGAQAFNGFNHANFSNPNSVVGSSSFGSISSVQAPPTSPYGSFQSAAVTQRVLVVTGKLSF